MLLDTCIIIDYLRGKPGAIDFLEGLSNVPAISTTTVAELYAGIKGKNEQALLKALVESFEVYDLSITIAEEAGELYQKFKPSHGLDIIDAMIAATARVHSLKLATLNLKHFPMFPELKRPY